MKLEKNKIVFIGFILVIVIFMVLYGISLNQKTEDTDLEQPIIPELKDIPKEYDSKLEAVDAIKEERETTKPSLYGELENTKGTYESLWEDKERQRIVDSIYREGRIDYAKGTYRESTGIPMENVIDDYNESIASPKKKVDTIDFSKAHRHFFHSNTNDSDIEPQFILAMVNGEQSVRSNNRLELRLVTAIQLNGRFFKRNTLIYGFVSFRANRVFVTISHIGQHPINLKAYDLLDGSEGIYVENSYQEEATKEVLDDAVQDLNLPGVPQVNGIKQVFRRSNRTVRVTIHDQYQLILKP